MTDSIVLDIKGKLTMKLVWIFAFLPFCLGAHEVSNETCMEVANSYPITFTSLVNGKAYSP